MASPFRYFRKHQKILLAVFGVLLMVSFLVVSQMQKSVNSSRQQGNGESDAAVSWLHQGQTQTISNTKLVQMRYRRDLARKFLNEIDRIAQERKATPQAPPLDRSDDDRSIVAAEIMAQEALDLGVDVTNEMVLEYLDLRGGQSIAQGEYADIVERAAGQPRQHQALMEQLRTELLAQQYMRLAGLEQVRQQALRLYGYETGPVGLSPTLARHYYDRLHRKATFEVLDLAVEDYLSGVGEPSQADVEALYEQYKNNYSMPDRPEPGFRQPAKRRFQYVKADFETLLTAAMKNVTDEAVATYYEENKESFRIDDEPDDGEPDDGEPDDGDSADDGDEPTTSPPADTTEPDEGEGDAGDRDTGEGATDDSPDESSNGQSRAIPDDQPTTPVVFTSLEDDDPASNDPASDTTAAPTDDNSSTDDPSASDSNTTTPSDDPSPSPSEPSSSEPAKGDQPNGDAPDATEPAEEPRYRPLEEESEGIRRTLAREPARKAMIEALDAVKGEMDAYYRIYRQWELERLEDQDLPQPPLPDLKALAEQLSLTVDATELVDIREMADHVLGKVSETEYATGASGQLQPMQRDFLRSTFGDRDQLYKPSRLLNGFYASLELGFGMFFNVDAGYVYWPTEIVEEQVPELAAVRDEVVAAWKLDQARELARQDANEKKRIALKAGGDVPLKTTFSDADVTETKEMTWMTTGDVPLGSNSTAWQSDFEEVEGADEKFMELIFGLRAGEIAVPMNYAQSHVYLVRMIQQISTPEALNVEFLGGRPHQHPAIRNIAGGEMGAIINDWRLDFQREMQINWYREPYGGSQF